GRLAPLARVAPTQSVHQVRPDQRGVIRGEALAIIQQLGGGGLTGKLGRAAGVVVLQIAAPEHYVAAVGGDVPVDLGNVGIVFASFVRGEAEPREIPAVAHRLIVGERVYL